MVAFLRNRRVCPWRITLRHVLSFYCSPDLFQGNGAKSKMATSDSILIALPDVPQALRNSVSKGTPIPTYYELYHLALNGEIDATRKGRRLFVTAETVRQIARRAEKQ